MLRWNWGSAYMNNRVKFIGKRVSFSSSRDIPPSIDRLRSRAPGLSKYPNFNEISFTTSRDVYKGISSLGEIKNQYVDKYKESVVYAKRHGEIAGQRALIRESHFAKQRMEVNLKKNVLKFICECIYPGYQFNFDEVNE